MALLRPIIGTVSVMVCVCVLCIGSALVDNSALSGLLSKLQPSLIQPLLRRLVFDVPHLTDYNKLALKVMKIDRQTHTLT